MFWAVSFLLLAVVIASDLDLLLATSLSFSGCLEPAAEDRPGIDEVRAFLSHGGGGGLAKKASYKSGRVRIERSFSALSLTILPDGPGGSLSSRSNTTTSSFTKSSFEHKIPIAINEYD